MADAWGWPAELLAANMDTPEFARWVGFYNLRNLRDKRGAARAKAAKKVTRGR